MTTGLPSPGFWQRLRALVRKELNQIRRDRRLMLSLVIPPTMQLLLFGFALDSTVSDLKLGVLDESKTPESRELVADMTESKSFRFGGDYLQVNTLERDIGRGALDAGVVIPYDFARTLHRGSPTNIQFILNAVNANSAAIGEGYARGVLASYNTQLAAQGLHAQVSPVSHEVSRKGSVRLTSAYLFNPGLVTRWFIVTGVFGVLLLVNGTIVSSGAMIKEREAGTVEQLLMCPAGTTEIVIAKLAPLFALLSCMALFALVLIRVVFAVPIRGSVVLVYCGAAMCLMCGVGIGTFMATFTRSAQQAMLLTFFVIPPLAALSGAVAPIEAMPKWMQQITIINPIRHFGVITRGVMVKGSTLADLWPNFLALIIFTLVLMTLSVRRFRKQLG